MLGSTEAVGSVRTGLPHLTGVCLGGSPEPKISLSLYTWTQHRQEATGVAGASSLRAKARHSWGMHAEEVEWTSEV